MAWYTATHTCGHSEEINLIGKHTERERRLDWLASRPCLDCVRAAQRAAAEQQATAQALPALTGSPKQVSWALTLRAQALAGATELVNAAQAQRAPIATELAGRLASLRGQTSAAWWIDHRYDSARQLLAVMPMPVIVAAPVAPAGYDKAAIMRRAWAIARQGASRFGGRASQYLAESLRQAWAEARQPQRLAA